jgi:hypothetical protein
MALLRRHFIFKHPLFRSSETATGIPWQKSVYYLWWEFLRRNAGYKRTCDMGGVGPGARLFADFGDVHSKGFKEWWSEGDRGARLFAEPAAPLTVSRMSRQDLTDLLPNWDDKTTLIVAIPLSFPKRFIEQKIADILKSHHKRKRGQRLLGGSRALYPVRAQFNFHSMKVALDVFDLRERRPDLTLWQLAQELRFTQSLSKEELKLGGSSAVDKRAVMSAIAYRKIKQAELLIEGVGRGVFPAR